MRDRIRGDYTWWTEAKREFLICPSIFNHSFFLLLHDYVDSNGNGIPKTDLNHLLRECDRILEKENGVMLSESAKKKCGGVVVVKEGSPKPKEVPLWMEHIIPVSHRLDMLIQMYKPGTTTRKELDDFITETFYGVYKLKTEEPVEYNAESLLSEDNRRDNLIKMFLDKKNDLEI